MRHSVSVIKKLVLGTLMTLMVLTLINLELGHASRQIQYEIKPTPNDVEAKGKIRYDHIRIMTQEMPCEAAGEIVAVAYESILGYSQGTTLVGACKLEFRHSAEACANDNSVVAQSCYNEAIDHYGLQGVHRKIKVQLYDESGKPSFPTGQTSPGSGLNLNRTTR